METSNEISDLWKERVDPNLTTTLALVREER
jgi:hypothetical protein